MGSQGAFPIVSASSSDNYVHTQNTKLDLATAISLSGQVVAFKFCCRVACRVITSSVVCWSNASLRSMCKAQLGELGDMLQAAGIPACGSWHVITD